MIHIEDWTAWDAYPTLLKQVLNRGRIRAARGMNTLDAGMVVISLESPERSMLAGLRPNYGTRVAAAEAIQLVGGFHDPRLMLDASPKFADYIEPDGYFHGAYGLRVNMQVAAAIDKLVADGDTRQAVVTLWDPMRDNMGGKNDYPCTVALRFEIDRGSLCMDVLMRSNDAWLGLPYDIFQFTQLQVTVARALEFAPGRYRHSAWSMHIYERDIDACVAASTLNPKMIVPSDVVPRGFETPGIQPRERFVRAMERAQSIAAGATHSMTLSPSEEWYRARVAPRVEPATADVG